MHDNHGADVLARARAGDERAFLALYRAAQPGLLRYLSVLVGADAERVAAQTWIEVNEQLAGFSGGLDSFRGWVAGIGRRRAHELLLAGDQAARAAVPLDVHGGPTPPRAARALQLIAELPTQEAEAITLRAVMRMGEDEAAGVLGVGRPTLRRSAVRGLLGLIRRLDPHSDAPARRGVPDDLSLLHHRDTGPLTEEIVTIDDTGIEVSR